MSHSARAEPELWVSWLGTVEYRAALELQERVRDARQTGLVPDVMLLLEHPPVYTRGRRSGAGELPMGVDWYRSQGIDVVDTDRGGKVTYHGPGQLVGYPIVRVDDVVAYVRLLERAIVRALGEEGVPARARVDEGPDYTGVWVGDGGADGVGHGWADGVGHGWADGVGYGGPPELRKIASIGVHVARGVATHGFAVNVENDLQPFGWVVPCGLDGVQMTSLIKETRGRRPDGSGATGSGQDGGRAGGAADGRMRCFRKRMAYAVAIELGLRQRIVSLERLEAALNRPPSRASALAATT